MSHQSAPSEFDLIEGLGVAASHGLELPQYSYGAKTHTQVAEFLKELESRTGMMNSNHYFRAGRTYMTITHSMGKAGNLFFKSVFENLLKECAEKPFVTSDEKTIRVIFRI